MNMKHPMLFFLMLTFGFAFFSANTVYSASLKQWRVQMTETIGGAAQKFPVQILEAETAKDAVNQLIKKVNPRRERIGRLPLAEATDDIASGGCYMTGGCQFSVERIRAAVAQPLDAAAASAPSGGKKKGGGLMSTLGSIFKKKKKDPEDFSRI